MNNRAHNNDAGNTEGTAMRTWEDVNAAVAGLNRSAGENMVWRMERSKNRIARYSIISGKCCKVHSVSASIANEPSGWLGMIGYVAERGA